MGKEERAEKLIFGIPFALVFGAAILVSYNTSNDTTKKKDENNPAAVSVSGATAGNKAEESIDDILNSNASALENPIGITVSVYPQNFDIPGEISAELHYSIQPQYHSVFLERYSDIEVTLSQFEKKPLKGFIDLNAKTGEPYIRKTIAFRYGKVELPNKTNIEVHGTDKNSGEKKLIYQGTLNFSKK